MESCNKNRERSFLNYRADTVIGKAKPIAVQNFELFLSFLKLY